MSTPDSLMVSNHQSPWARTWFVLAAAFVAVLVVVGAYLVITGPSDDVAGVLPPASAPSASTEADGADASVCGLAPGDQTIPALAPETTWTLVGRVAAPTSSIAGPGVDDDGFRSCYARSPLGAVLAAANNLVMSQSPDHARRATMDLFAPGRGRDILLESQGAASDDELRSSLEAMDAVQIAAFRVQDYTDDQSVIVMAMRKQDGTLVSAPMVMAWSDGDWKLLLSPTGGAEGQAVPDLTGLIPWSGI